MKNSGAPDVGDIVVAKFDRQRGLTCYGTILECKGTQCLVLWSSESLPIGWWKRTHLEVIQGEENEQNK